MPPHNLNRDGLHNTSAQSRIIFINYSYRAGLWCSLSSGMVRTTIRSHIAHIRVITPAKLEINLAHRFNLHIVLIDPNNAARHNATKQCSLSQNSRHDIPIDMKRQPNKHLLKNIMPCPIPQNTTASDLTYAIRSTTGLASRRSTVRAAMKQYTPLIASLSSYPSRNRP